MPLINRNNTYNIITNNSDNIITNNEVSNTIYYSSFRDISCYVSHYIPSYECYNYIGSNNYITNNDIVDANTIVNINEDNVRNTTNYDYVRELRTSASKIFFSGNKLDREKFSMEIE